MCHAAGLLQACAEQVAAYYPASFLQVYAAATGSQRYVSVANTDRLSVPQLYVHMMLRACSTYTTPSCADMCSHLLPARAGIRVRGQS